MRFSDIVTVSQVLASGLVLAKPIQHARRQATASTVQSVGSYSYVGCAAEPFYNGGSGRTLTNSSESLSTMTVETCASFCSGYNYFGVEYSSECYCGDSLGSGTTIDSDNSNCVDTCSGNSAEYCGGSGHMNLYSSLGGSSSGSSSSSSSSAVAATSPSSSIVAASSSSSSSVAASSSSSSSVATTSSSSSSTSSAVPSTTSSSTTSSVAPATTSASSAAATSATSTTSTVSVTTLTAVPSASGYTFVNCAVEPFENGVSSRALIDASTSTDSMTVEYCASYCTGYEFFGVEYASQCYCGNVIQNGTTLDQTNGCNMGCSGNGNEECGGSGRFNLYEVSNGPAVTLPTTYSAASSTTSTVSSATSTVVASTTASSAATSTVVASTTAVAASSTSSATSTVAASSTSKSSSVVASSSSAAASSSSSSSAAPSTTSSSTSAAASTTSKSSSAAASSTSSSSSSAAPSSSSSSSSVAPTTTKASTTSAAATSTVTSVATSVATSSSSSSSTTAKSSTTSSTTSSAASATSSAFFSLSSCPSLTQKLSVLNLNYIFTPYYTGAGYTENAINAGNVTPLSTPAYTYTISNSYSACQAAAQCLSQMSSLTLAYKSFDLHYRTDLASWQCVAYNGNNLLGVSFNVPNSAVSHAYGFNGLVSL